MAKADRTQDINRPAWVPQHGSGSQSSGGCCPTGQPRRAATSRGARARVCRRRYPDRGNARPCLRQPGRSLERGGGDLLPMPGRESLWPLPGRVRRGGRLPARRCHASIWRKRRAVSPRVSSARGQDDDSTAGFLALRGGGHAVDGVDEIVNDLAVGGLHGLEHPSSPGRQNLLRYFLGETL